MIVDSIICHINVTKELIQFNNSSIQFIDI
jgi:hypothetical protein